MSLIVGGGEIRHPWRLAGGEMGGWRDPPPPAMANFHNVKTALVRYCNELITKKGHYLKRARANHRGGWRNPPLSPPPFATPYDRTN